MRSGSNFSLSMAILWLQIPPLWPKQFTVSRQPTIQDEVGWRIRVVNATATLN